MVREDLKLSDILTKKAFINSIITNAAIGGSSNFVIHLLAIAGRIGIDLHLEDFDNVTTNIPLIANLQPAGKFFMEDLFYAGGIPAVLKELKEFLHNDCITVNGKTIAENYEQSVCYNREVITTIDVPFNPVSGLVVLKGNLCENGAVLKPACATTEMMQHTGKAVVFKIGRAHV